MSDHRPTRRPFRVPALLATVGVALLVGCSSSASDGGSSDGGGIGTVRRPADVRAANEAYLLQIGYQPDQATCVSRAVTVDLEELLSGSDGGKPTDRPGFDQFAAATTRCIEADPALTTTTTPAG